MEKSDDDNNMLYDDIKMKNDRIEQKILIKDSFANNELSEQLYIHTPSRNKDKSKSDDKSKNPRIRRLKNPNIYPAEFFLDEKYNQASEVATKLLFGEKIDENVSPDILGYAIRDLESRSDIYFQNGAYDESSQASKAAEKAKGLQIDIAKKYVQKIEMKDVSLRKGHMHTDYQIFSHLNKAKIHDLRTKNQNYLKSLQLKHESELEQHKIKWNSPNTMRKYLHKSRALIQLQEMEKSLIDMRQYQEAAAIKLQVQQLMKKEIAEMKRQYDHDYQKSYEKLIEKHKNEMDSLKSVNKLRRQVLKNQINTERQAFTNRKSNLARQEEIAHDPNRLWILKHRKDTSNLCPKPKALMRKPNLHEYTSHFLPAPHI